ncbi:MAG: hypothetical protein A2W29_12660 [Gemmatimonadetes bacterium RBG_16_66_8]|nr:MAG: hypothetical protein A2W29_12660 [Gemmatimonadetes bacterium RBG_16_66_8]
MITPITLSSAIDLLVRSRAADGKSAPSATSPPTIMPKYPSGIPASCAMDEYAELSQLKNALMSQTEPAKIDSG